MKLTDEDFEEEYDADKWNTQIIKIFDSYDEQQQFKYQILQNQKIVEKIKEWKNELNKDDVDIIWSEARVCDELNEILSTNKDALKEGEEKT